MFTDVCLRWSIVVYVGWCLFPEESSLNFFPVGPLLNLFPLGSSLNLFPVRSSLNLLVFTYTGVYVDTVNWCLFSLGS